MKKAVAWKWLFGMLFMALFVLSAPVADARPAEHSAAAAYTAMNRQPLSVKLSSAEVHVGESVWLTVSGGTEPYVLIAVENKIQVVSRGKNTYQISGLAVGNSKITIGDNDNNTITRVIAVLPKR